MASQTASTLKETGHVVELSFPLPKCSETRIHLQLTIRKVSILLFITTALNGDTSTVASLGSFVLALPDRLNPGQTISTPLCTYDSSLDFTTRLANFLARKSGKAVYVGNSVSFASTGMGGTIDEEMEGFKKVVEILMDEINKNHNYGPEYRAEI